VVVGGIMLAPNLILVVVPILIALFSRRQPPATNGARPAAHATTYAARTEPA
jgi:cobalt-zinc-cadmium resistance protein CzcA